jgi:hypothetical protein
VTVPQNFIYSSTDVFSGDWTNNATLQFKPRNLDRFPRLDTILMVEKCLYGYGSGKRLTQVWKLLPKKVMWTIFVTIIDYLEYSGKIRIEKDKTVTWMRGSEISEERGAAAIW